MTPRSYANVVCQWHEFAGCVADDYEGGRTCGNRIEYVLGPTEFGTFDLCAEHAEQATDYLPEVPMRDAR